MTIIRYDCWWTHVTGTSPTPRMDSVTPLMIPRLAISYFSSRFFFGDSLHWFTELLKQTSYQMFMKASAVHSVIALCPFSHERTIILPNLKHESYCEVSVVYVIRFYWWTQYLGTSYSSCVFDEIQAWNTFTGQVNKYNQRRHIVRHAKTHHTCFSLGETQT